MLRFSEISIFTGIDSTISKSVAKNSHFFKKVFNGLKFMWESGFVVIVGHRLR
jgi:hypothetical protein